jgi:hypothetical protein
MLAGPGRGDPGILCSLNAGKPRLVSISYVAIAKLRAAAGPDSRGRRLARERGSMYDAVLMIMGVAMFVAFLAYSYLCEKM